jgi:peptidoglycan/xylan/chitin deacetylase (PgdA/CDA1 family)
VKTCFVVCFFALIISCNNRKKEIDAVTKHSVKRTTDSVPPALVADASTIFARKQVPVLCYHHIKNGKAGDYVVPPAKFAEQMKALSDSGYTTILPDQLYNYLTTGAALPAKPVMLTFDDTDLEQFTVGAAEMNKYNFKGAFFIMNISIGRPRYMNKEQLKQLADNGNEVEAHTWDHHRVTEYTDADWDKQLTEAKTKLQFITAKPVEYFAYPFGLWNISAIQPLQKRGIKMAFQLSAKRDSTQPLYTVRRMLVPGTWTTKGLFKSMKATFHL